MHTRQSQDSDATLGVGTAGAQYLTFLLDGEEYGVDILRVQEIKGWDTATALPNTPSYIKGVINLRGTIVPLVDLRARFGLEPLPYGTTTVVIVLKVLGEQGERVMGLVVDAVSDVYTVTEDQLKATPDFGGAVQTACIEGIATAGEKMVIMLAIDHLLDADELTVVDRVTSC